MSDDKSELQKTLEARVRPTWTIDATSFLAANPQTKGELRMRVLTVGEHSSAVLEATRSGKEASRDLGMENDPDFITNYKTACALQRACLRMDRDLPCFDSGKALMATLTAGELGLLLGHYTNVLRLHGPGEAELDAEKSEGLAMFLAVSDPSESINHLLSNFTPANLSLLSVLLSVKVKALADENAQLITNVQRLGDELKKTIPLTPIEQTVIGPPSSEVKVVG